MEKPKPLSFNTADDTLVIISIIFSTKPAIVQHYFLNLSVCEAAVDVGGCWWMR